MNTKDRLNLDDPKRFKRTDASTIPGCGEIDDPCMTLKELHELVGRLIHYCGGSTIIKGDAGYNNISFYLYKKLPRKPKVQYPRYSCLGCRAWFKTEIARDQHRLQCQHWSAVVAAVKAQTGAP